MRLFNVFTFFGTLLIKCSFHQVKSLGINRSRKLDYDLIVIGAGASGMFAAGTAAGFGCKTLLIDKHDLEEDADFYIGGDCTNAACVPSKAIRCAAKIATLSERASSILDSGTGTQSLDQFSSIARRHARKTTNAVRGRESPERVASSPNLDIIYTPELSFDNKRQMTLKNPFLFNSTYSGFIECENESDRLQVRGKKFIICTGAGPSIPPNLKKSAKKVGLDILTYRSIFRPDGEGKKSDKLWNMKPIQGEMQKIVIVGGGPSACEMAQSLARLNKYIDITVIAPSILSSEDVAARTAARNFLIRDGVNIINRRRVMKVSRFGKQNVLVLDDKTRVPVDVLICATGRDPGQNLKKMKLEKAGINWSPKEGVTVNSKLQSISSKHIYAAGDCASAVPSSDRRAAHAGWTGYHAAQSAIFPRFLIPSDSVHPAVPRVTFMDPEIASIGMTRAECVEKFGTGGFKHMKVAENNTDRADIDNLERSSTDDGFVELRVSVPNGNILGATICSPAASEIINELGVAMVNKLTVRDIAKCIHAYPSYGYLMHRVALSLAMSDIWGMLAACGPIGRAIGCIGRNTQGQIRKVFRKRKSRKQMNRWESIGTEREFDYHVIEGMKSMTSVCFLEASKDASFCDAVRRHTKDGNIPKSEKEVFIEFVRWLDSKP